MDTIPASDGTQTYRIEIRFDHTGTLADATAKAHEIAAACGGEVTDIADENWDTVGP